MIDGILIVVRLALFSVFALAAIGKFLDLSGSEKAVKDFGTPEELAKPLAIALPFAEGVFAFCFLYPSTAWVGAVGGLILLISFTAGMIWQMAQGNAPDCHCFGQIHSEPVSRKTLVRNIIFSLLAGFLVIQGRDNQGPGLATGDDNAMQLFLIFLLLAISVAALFYLKKLLDIQKELLRRVELLEVLSQDGIPVDRNEAGHPHDGLPIGSPFPDFKLTNGAEKEVSLRTVIANGLPAMFFFVSPTCEPCKALLPDIERWEAELGDRVNFVLFSSGTARENEGKFGVFSDDVILQKKREIAEEVYARWTPTAMFIRSDGTIGSTPAAGDAAIRGLVDKIREKNVLSPDVYFSNGNNFSGRPPKIGEKLPEFSLSDLDGKNVTSTDLVGKRTLAVFWSPTCPHCQAMMDDLQKWDRARTETDPNLIVFSDGPADEHAELDLRSPIVIDAGYKTAEKIGMFGTPSAVLLDDDGKVITETALGARNIWALIGKRK
jgi:thiol-disulfide isomerase/thioredoxin